MKKCPFLKIVEEENNIRDEIMKSCIGDNCMAYDQENKSCKLIEKSDFKFIN